MSIKLKLFLLAGATLLVGVIAVSDQSFWIDEGAAAMKAVQATPALWWHSLRAEGHSNLQLLPHLFYLWGWEKVFGHSEVALRAANVPLLFGGLAAALWGLAFRARTQFWFCLLTLLNAFTWYYVNEARPYILLFAAACIPLACLIRLLDRPEESADSRAWLPFFLFGTFLLSATSLIAVPWAGAWMLTAACLLGFRNFLRLLRRHLFTCVVFGSAMAALGWYYLWTLKLGARASPIARTSLITVPLILYEQLGLLGLGPGRNELRQGGFSTLRPFALWLALGLAAFAVPAWQVIAASGSLRRNRKARVLLLAGVILPLVAVLGAGLVMHVRILGRHLAPLFPIVVFVIALALERLLEKKKRAGLGPVIFLLSVLAVSSWQIRFAPRHARDDYRTAASIAAAAMRAGKHVWWAADKDTGQYYRLPLADSGGEAAIVWQMNPPTADLTRLAPPDMIVLSKPDIYDATGAIRRFVEERGFVPTRTLQSFQVFENAKARLAP